MKVKRCPHCNTYFGTPILWRDVMAGWWKKRYNMECPVCHWNSAKAFTQRGAIAKWNDDTERCNNWQTLKEAR